MLTEFFASTENRYDWRKRHREKQLVVLLPGAGCEWAKQSGGCYMCGFNCSTRKYTHGALLPALVFRALIGKVLKQPHNAETLVIYNGGSFLNPKEIPSTVPLWLCDQVRRSPNLQQLFVESRPGFVDSCLVREMVKHLGSKKLKVGIGLECVTDLVRDKCVHKGFTREDYERAVNVLKAEGVSTLTYVLLKPLFLSENEAIREAVKTITYAFKHGSDEIALESAFVQKGTLMYKLFLDGNFRPPWLWSIIKVVQSTYHLGYVYVGGFGDEPPPIATPTNCPKCTPTVLNSLQHFREHYDLSVLTGLDCECRTQWRDELVKPFPPLEERIGIRVAA